MRISSSVMATSTPRAVYAAMVLAWLLRLGVLPTMK
jgi:hypothetical protein